MKYLLLLFLTLSLGADNNYSLRIAHGKVTDSDFGQALCLDIQSFEHDLRVTSLDVGYLLKKDAFDLPLDFYLKGGLAYFDEASTQSDVYEGTIYIKVYYNIDFWQNRVRLGFGDGISYTSSLLYFEKVEAIEKNDYNSKFLNYIDFSVDFDIGKLFRYEALRETYLGFAIKHRSGIFGLINSVKHGGSNYYVLSLEKNF
ncbi:hypothetical protein M947_06675 [Sulfurimonas hongkongensis]|uniref:Outer membrane protein beta-barrel domain-containing protein n=1 Tax=Sulfurimonas hongkongensis TaxID=1172190 RepID=T0KRT6_9BACT|nr:hypothetical protein [Sulfurimonas hongkongensis]EQB39674.1 hypothetical protein M947_06675 [Sulfurimonas hongkongensis]